MTKIWTTKSLHWVARSTIWRPDSGAVSATTRSETTSFVLRCADTSSVADARIGFPQQTAEATNTVDAFIAVEQRGASGLKSSYKISPSLFFFFLFFSNSPHNSIHPLHSVLPEHESSTCNKNDTLRGCLWQKS